MAAMPRPIRVPAPSRRLKPRRPELAIWSAKPEATMAITSEATVIGMSYAIGIGSSKASMPMKCMDQIPAPMEKAPPISQ